MDSFNDVLDAAKAYCREHTADATYQYYISGTNRCKRARCEVWIWWNVGSKPAFFAIFSTFIAHIVENCTLL